MQGRPRVAQATFSIALLAEQVEFRNRLHRLLTSHGITLGLSTTISHFCQQHGNLSTVQLVLVVFDEASENYMDQLDSMLEKTGLPVLIQDMSSYTSMDSDHFWQRQLLTKIARFQGKSSYSDSFEKKTAPIQDHKLTSASPEMAPESAGADWRLTDWQEPHLTTQVEPFVLPEVGTVVAISPVADLPMNFALISGHADFLVQLCDFIVARGGKVVLQDSALKNHQIELLLSHVDVVLLEKSSVAQSDLEVLVMLESDCEVMLLTKPVEGSDWRSELQSSLRSLVAKRLLKPPVEELVKKELVETPPIVEAVPSGGDVAQLPGSAENEQPLSEQTADKQSGEGGSISDDIKMFFKWSYDDDSKGQGGYSGISGNGNPFGRSSFWPGIGAKSKGRTNGNNHSDQIDSQNSQLVNRLCFYFVNAFLLGLLVLSIVKIVRAKPDEPALVLEVEPIEQQPFVAQEDAPGAGARLAALHLFGKNVGEGEQTGPLEQWRGIRLIGLLGGGSETLDSAILNINGKDGVYKERHVVYGEVILAQIGTDYVRLQEYGKSAILRISRAASVPDESVTKPRNVTTQSVVAQDSASTHSPEIVNSTLDFSNMPVKGLASKASFDSQVINGSFKGFRINDNNNNLFRYGIEADDVILAVNGMSIDDPVTGVRVITSVDMSHAVHLLIKRNNRLLTYVVQL